jgi:hypothetical protein
MAYFNTQNTNLGIFLGALERKMLVYLDFLNSYLVFFGHLVYFVVIWYSHVVLECCTKKNLATLYNGV